MSLNSLILILLLFPLASLEAKTPGTSAASGHLTFDMKKKPLSEILDTIQNQCGVRVRGLDERRDESMSLEANNEPAERVIKRLLRSMGESSYAFVYNRTRLRYVAVYPGGKSRSSLPPRFSAVAEQDLNETVRTTRILRITPNSQAENLDLQKDDMVVEYNGKKIETAENLVAAVKETSPQDVVEMTVIREKRPIRIVLNGGMIGINIISVSVPRAELGAE